MCFVFRGSRVVTGFLLRLVFDGMGIQVFFVNSKLNSGRVIFYMKWGVL